MIGQYYSLIHSMGSGTIPSSLNTDLVSVYKAENNTNDSYGSTNGTSQGGLTYTTGKSGNAFNFNGTNSYIDYNDQFDILTYSCSFNLWFNTNIITGANVLISKTFAGSIIGRYHIYTFDNVVGCFLQVDDGNLDLRANLNTINTNTWYMLSIVIDRSDKIKIYLNGNLLTLTTLSGTNNLIPYISSNWDINKPFRIGAYTGTDSVTPTNFFNGKMDEISIWRKALTAIEITELYNSGSGKFYPY